MSGTNLAAANLFGANLSHSEINYANLFGARLTGANLQSARLSRANLTQALLIGTDFSATRLFETIFVDTNLKDAIGLDTCDHPGPSTLDFRTLTHSGPLPTVFLRGCGLPELLIDILPAFFNEGIQFYSCFISYSHNDKRFARRLFDTLQGRGIRCWLDDHEMRVGDDIYEQVDRGIKLWDKTLLCCSKAALTSWWVNHEIDKAFDKERQLMKERGEKVLSLIPLNLDGYLFGDEWTNGRKSEVHSRRAADFTAWETDAAEFERQVEKVILALRADDGARGKAPAAKL
jgi:hypothetical protein